MLWHKISRSQKVAALSCDSARLLYTWLIPHCDNLGRMDGDPDVVRGTVVPTLSVRRTNVVLWLSEMQELGLIQWYEVEGLWYIQVAGWDDHQRIGGNMSKDSDFPAPNGQVRTAYVRRIDGVSPEGKGKGEGKELPMAAAGASAGSGLFPQEPPADDGSCTPAEWLKAHDEFYDAYPRKVKRPDSERAWKKVRPQHNDTFNAIMDGLDRWASHWKLKTDRDKIPYPATWINAEQWKDQP